LLGFSYLYLLLCFSILPAFAVILKTRAKKLAQSNTNANTSEIASTSSTKHMGTPFFDGLVVKFSGLKLVVSTDAILSSCNLLMLKNEAFYKFNFVLLNEFKIITFYI
jgi:hypothetical protein